MPAGRGRCGEGDGGWRGGPGVEGEKWKTENNGRHIKERITAL